jgi:hypothetical protein
MHTSPSLKRHVNSGQAPSHLQRQGYELRPSKLIDALVVRAAGKADAEIARIVCEITERLNELKANKQQRTCEAKGGEREDDRTKGTSEKQKASREK